MEPAALGPENKRLPTLPALDGIRALAIMAVVLYHGDLEWFPGGLLGVEVFFVLSGYLITSLLWSELRATNQIGIGTFLTRRARRLFPALFVMLFVVVAAWVLFLPTEIARTRGDVAAAATYTSNWYLIHSDHSYFVTFTRPSPFGHLWSLAIEEQFYLLWPPVLYLLWRFVKRPGRVAAVIGAGAAASFAALMLLYHGGDPSRVYYGTDTRASGLLIGAALAVLWRPFETEAAQLRSRPWALDAATVGSAAFLIWSFTRFDEFAPFTYRPGMLLVACATAALIASCVHPRARVGRALGTAPLRWLGRRSYGVYIWYFPVFALTRPGVDLDWSIERTFALRVAITLALAMLSFRFVEEPIRNGAIGRWADRTAERMRAPFPDGRRYRLGLGATSLAAALLVAPIVGAALDAKLAPPTEQTSSPVAFLADEPIASIGSLTAAAARPAPPPSLGTVIAIGDSVMVGARPAMRAKFDRISIDAAVGRQVSDGIARLERLRDAGRLGRVVIIHLGNNGHFTSAQFDRIMRVLSTVERVIFVNVKVPRRWEASVNRVLVAGVHRHSRAKIVNWRHLWRSCGGRVFGSDATHLTSAGARCYARILAGAVSP